MSAGLKVVLGDGTSSMTAAQFKDFESSVINPLVSSPEIESVQVNIIITSDGQTSTGTSGTPAAAAGQSAQ